MEITTLLTIMGLLVALTNIITEVIKKVTWDKIPTSLLAVIVSLVLTLVTFFAYCQTLQIVATWYFIVAAVVVGFMVGVNLNQALAGSV
jgi:glucan phosphoethanolaminetransferase (alkaline phosphatase superfamily)